MSSNKRHVIKRPEGVTTAERYLKKLCDRTFLSLWSYSGIYRNQGNKGQGHGKEICDLIVVFEEHVIIFSDKDCSFPDTGNLELDWQRWYRRAVEKSAAQIWGAERWIKSHPERVFLDRACQQPFPIQLPDAGNVHFHRVIVAHDASERCKKELGGSGSLMIVPEIVGAGHFAKFKDGGKPFAIGQVDPDRGYVHVLDDTSLDVLLKTLDTITDFVSYLQKKESFICSGRLIVAAGEDDLLAHYLKYINNEEQHDFIIPSDKDAIIIDEGFWDEFTTSPERAAQLEANKISYSWDALIETFNTHILNSTQYFKTHQDFGTSEIGMRFLAREPRTRRRLLAQSLIDFINRTEEQHKATRTICPSNSGDPYYIFFAAPPFEKRTR